MLYKLLYTHTYMGFLGISAGKESPCNAGEPSLIPGLGRSPEEGIGYSLQYSWASLVVQSMKNLPAMWETWVQSLGWEDPLEEGMATQSSILAWRIPWTEEPDMLQSLGSQRVRHDWATKPTHIYIRTYAYIYIYMYIHQKHQTCITWNMYMYIHTYVYTPVFAIHPKLTQHCKSTIHQ